jgi:hypothetical protein
VADQPAGPMALAGSTVVVVVVVVVSTAVAEVMAAVGTGNRSRFSE